MTSWPEKPLLSSGTLSRGPAVSSGLGPADLGPSSASSDHRERDVVTRWPRPPSVQCLTGASQQPCQAGLLGGKRCPVLQMETLRLREVNVSRAQTPCPASHLCPAGVELERLLAPTWGPGEYQGST